MAELGSVIVKVGADITDLTKKLDQAGKETEGGTKLISARFLAMGAAVAAAAAAAATAIGYMALKEMEAIDASKKLGESIGATVTGLRSLNMAADLSGLEGMESSITRLNQNLGAFEQGTGRARESIVRLNLDVAAMGDMDADQKVAYLADQIQRSGMSAQEASFHLKRLGFDQAEAAGVFLKGGDAFRQAREDVERFGLAVSQLDASKMEIINDNITSTKAAMSGLVTRMTTALTPAFLEVTDSVLASARGFFDAYNQVSDFDKATDDAAEGVQDFTADGRTLLTPMLEGLVRLAALAADAFRVLGAIIGAIVKSATGGISAINALLQTASQGSAWLDKKAGFISEAEYQSVARGAENARDGAVKAAEETRAAWGRVMDVGGEGKYQAAGEKIIEAMAAKRAANMAMKDAPAAKGGRASGGGGKEDKEAEDAAKAAADKAAEEAKRQQEAARRELEAVQRFLATKRELEAEDAAMRIAALDKARDMGLIGEQIYQESILGVKQKHAESMSAFEDEDFKTAQEKLDKKRELELLGDEEYFKQQMELAAAHYEQKTEMENVRYQTELENLQLRRDEELISLEGYNALLEAAALGHEDTMTTIAAEAAAARLALKKRAAESEVSTFKALQDTMAALGAAGSRAAFNLHKAMAISSALVSAKESVVNAYNYGVKTGSPLRGLAMAAMAAATTASQIASIRSQSFGGGGSVSAGGGGGGGGASGGSDSVQAPTAEAAPAAKQTVTISLQGEVFGAKQVRDLIEKINDATKNGAILNMV